MLVAAQQRQLQLRTILPEESPSALVNKDQIEQVLINIVSNALKYTPDGGEVVISVQGQDSEVMIAVQDSGVGIPKADLPRIFERFYRVDKARSRKMGGTGLGLSIAQQIVSSHGGRIWIESEEGRGTLVAFTLPLSAAEEATLHA